MKKKEKDKKENPVKETFGILKLKRSIKEILDEIDKEGWDKDMQ